MPETHVHKPVVLIILDGWGIAPPSEGNAVTLAKTPNMSSYLASFPSCQLRASGEWVGLPRGEPGNSEVGHLNIGAGRIVYQDLPRINMSIADGSFLNNQAFSLAFEHAKKSASRVHLMGLVGLGGVHSSLEHLYALLWLCKEHGLNQDQVILHLFTDGRDSPPNVSPLYLSEIEYRIREIGTGKIASIIGRYYAMDRDKRWERVQKAYDLLTLGVGEKASSVLEAVEKAYKQGQTDEFITPRLIDSAFTPISDNDAVIFFNFRSDRSRQLTKAFISPTFDKFERQAHPKNLFFVTMTEYEKDLPVSAIAFPTFNVEMPLGRIISEKKLQQLHIAETEKYPHVTFFFNGGREDPFPGEKRIMLPSPKVATYDLKPEMSAYAITDILEQQLVSGIYDFVVVNFANGDMVGHTGVLSATIQAVEVVDRCLGRVVNAALSNLNGACIITADHGNAEEKVNLQTGEVLTEHTTNPVPFCIVASDLRGQRRLPSGILADITPTILGLMGINPPSSVTGRNLLS